MILMGCHLIVNHHSSLTSGKVLVSLGRHPPSPSFEGLRPPKEEQMFRNALYVRLVLLLSVLSAAAVFVGSEPWGPG